MQFLVYGRDRPGSLALKLSLTDEHWAFMDRYADRLVARGPTLTGAGLPTGSLHIVDLPGPDDARAFAYEDPYYVAGVFETVRMCRYVSLLTRPTAGHPGYDRFLVTSVGRSPIASRHLIAYGDLFTMNGEAHVGRAALLRAADPDAAARCAPPGAEVHRWRPGGRPSPL
ncbi:YciI family protein [Actinoplanes sp. URMC 104]|uniref:YciI family protein n=1 Tax=Actinoplanes sp. URMC 104 TaxID=3423409 RepID=UPI003F1BA78F